MSRTQCRLCGEEGHWEEDCPQADVDMPQAKRRVTFPVLLLVLASLKPGVLKRVRLRRLQNTKTRLEMWTSQEIQKARISWVSP